MGYVIVGLVSILIGGLTGFVIRMIIGKVDLNSAENRAKIILRESELEAESKKKELLLESKNSMIQERNSFERETRERRAELQKYERRVTQKEEQLERKLEDLEKKVLDVGVKEKECEAKTNEVSKLIETWHQNLEKLAGMSSEQAKEILMKELEGKAKEDAHHLITKIEEEANRTATKKAREVLLTTMQRV
ncbi:MAG: DUF3552 domain-containing protein, partial [Spirochaetales bacterium]|nr:DUF3552 domain-containing protein [Spirochaetales bacterium]